jgi:hypothetical protein
MKRKQPEYISLAVLSVVALTPWIGARAQPLSAQDLSVLAQSTTSDTDSALLYILGGHNPSTSVVPKTTFNYSATGDDTSWSGALSGTLVNPFSLSYTSTGESATSNSWTSTGSLGAIGVVSGFGSASIAYPTSTTFDVTFSDSLSAGGNTYSVTGSIPGTFNADGTYNFGPPLEISSNPVHYSGSGTPAYVGIFKWSYYRNYPNDVSDLWGIPIWPGGPWNNFYKTTPKPGTSMYALDGFIQTSVPEPSTWAMMLMGFFALGYAGYRRARKFAS